MARINHKGHADAATPGKETFLTPEQRVAARARAAGESRIAGALITTPRR